MKWQFNENEYTERNFETIPEGDYRVRITKVVEKIFNSGNEGFEITLDVNGHSSKLWYCLVLDPSDRARTNQRLGMFFNSFGISNYDLSYCNQWVGREGAVRVRHGAYKGTVTAQVAFCLGRKQQDRLPRWQDKQSEYQTSNNVFTGPSKSTVSTPSHRPFNGFMEF